MSEKQTYCPNCFTKYKVSVAQLTVARGMVCCAKCSTNFNALTHLVVDKEEPCSTTLPIPSANSTQAIRDNRSKFDRRSTTRTTFIGYFRS